MAPLMSWGKILCKTTNYVPTAFFSSHVCVCVYQCRWMCSCCGCCISRWKPPSDGKLYIVGLTMGSSMDELAVMGRWQVQQSPQVTAAYCDTFMTLACLSRTHTYIQTHTYTHTLSSSSALWWHALVMRLRSYLRHCSDKPCVYVCVAFSSVGKRTNGRWGQRARSITMLQEEPLENNENRNDCCLTHAPLL